MAPPTPPPDLADLDYRVRMRAIHALVEGRDPRAGEWIRPLLRDRESPVRNAAIVALGELRDQDAFDALASCLAATMSQERGNAVAALAALGDPRMREPVLQALDTEPEWYLRQAIIKTLSTFRADEDVIAALIARLADPDDDVRATAAVALANLRANKAPPALERMALTDTNAETTIRGLAVRNSWVASRAIEVIRTPEGPTVLDWPY